MSIPYSSFHHHSARRAAEATMVLSGAKILPILQLDLTNDMITDDMPRPQRSWEPPRLLWSHAGHHGGISAVGSVPPHSSHRRSCPAGRGTGAQLCGGKGSPQPHYRCLRQQAQLCFGAWHSASTKWHRRSPDLSQRQGKDTAHCGKPLPGQILLLPTLCGCLTEVLTGCSVRTSASVPMLEQQGWDVA